MVTQFLHKVPNSLKKDHEQAAFFDYLIKKLHEIARSADAGESYASNQSIYQTSSSTSAPSSFRIVEISAFGQYEANNFELVNSNGSTVLLPQRPTTQTIVKVRQASAATVTVLGNGRTINGQNQNVLSAQYTVRDYAFFAQQNAWGIV